MRLQAGRPDRGRQDAWDALKSGRPGPGPQAPDEARHGQSRPRSGAGLRGPPRRRPARRGGPVQVLGRGHAFDGPLPGRPGPDLRIAAGAGQGLRRVPGDPQARSGQPLGRAALRSPAGRARPGGHGRRPRPPWPPATGRRPSGSSSGSCPTPPTRRPPISSWPASSARRRTRTSALVHYRAAIGGRDGGQGPAPRIRRIPGRGRRARAEPGDPRKAGGGRSAEGRGRSTSASRRSGPSWASTSCPASTTPSRPSRRSPGRTWPR